MFEALSLPAKQARGIGRPVSRPLTIPAPIGGWNQRDAISAMQPNDALRLDNWIPDIGAVRLRRGFSSHGTGLSGNYVESLMQWSGPSSAKLFAATPTIIYDVTTAGAGSSSVTSLTNGRWSHTMFSTAAGNFLHCVNGQDAPRQYNGSAWSSPSWSGSGLTIANLDFVVSHMNRLWFIEKNTLNAWYGATAAVSGTLTKFNAPFRLGGYLVALGSWSRDGGSGPDDMLVMLTSKGECVIYAGTDPTSSTTSALVGIFKLPEPVGRRCLVKLGADLGVLTSLGLIPLSTVLGISASNAGASAINNKISGAFRYAYVQAGSNFGWQTIEYPKGNLLIVNVPVTARTTQYQYVMNTQTGAWARFTGINAGCWSLLGDAIYFGGNDGVVYKWDVDYSDDTDPIVATMQTAYSTMGTPQVKRFTMARPLFLSPPNYAPQVSLKTDYDTSVSSLTVISTTDPGTAWDVGSWDTSEWSVGAVPSLPWQGVAGIGVAGSIAFAVSAQSELVFNGVDILAEVGGML